MAVTFFLRSTRKGGSEVTIWVRIRNGVVSHAVSTHLKVPVNQWLKRSGWANENKQGLTYEERARLVHLNSTLYGLKSYLSDSAMMQGDNLTVTAFREYVERFLDLQRESFFVTPRDMVSYLHYKIEQMKTGEFTFKGGRYDPDTILVYQCFEKILIRFIRYYRTRYGVTLRWDNIERKTGDSFLNFLRKEGYLPSSIDKNVACFRSMIRFAKQDQIHDDADRAKYFYSTSREDIEATTKIYLTGAELQALFEMKLTGLKEKVRDSFLCGAYTAQRVSDFKRICADDFGVTSNGVRVIRLRQEKTNNLVVIPVLDENLETIARKYGYNLPSVSDQILNRYIKVILKDLSETVPSLAEMLPTVLTMKDREAEANGFVKFKRDEKGRVVRPRYELVTSHTARRSAITNLYLSKMFTERQIMSISGHKSQDCFNSYVRLSSDQIAEEIDRRVQEAKAQHAKQNPDGEF